MRFLLVMPLLAAGTLSAAPVPKELKKPDDRTAILGTWRAADDSSAWFAFAADGTLKTWHVTKGTEQPNSQMGWTWAITDAKARRARINRAENPAAGYDCVYEFSGDALKFDLILSAGEPASLQRHSLTRDKPGK